MKAYIEREGCISCGLCAETCPEVFRMAEDGFAEVHVDEVPEKAEERTVEAQENCPTSVIVAKN
jgi:ferredoxin